MSAPAISVVIAAYNAAHTLGVQLEALHAQVVDTEWEILVCDNGSTDDTAAVVRQAQDRMPRLRLVDASSRRGPGAARNAGARAAAAPLLAFCDADDVVAEGWLAIMLEALTTADLVTGQSRRPEFNARPGDPHTFCWSIYRVPYFPFMPGAGAGNLGVRREAFLGVGGFDEDLRTGEDLDLCWRLQLAGHDLVEDTRAVVYVANREGLGATIAQTFSYGVGDRRLTHKYALVADAYRLNGPQLRPRTGISPPSNRNASPRPPETGVRDAGALARIYRKATSVRRPSDLTNVTRKAATWAGQRFGRIDRSAPQISPPARLPQTWSA